MLRAECFAGSSALGVLRGEQCAGCALQGAVLRWECSAGSSAALGVLRRTVRCGERCIVANGMIRRSRCQCKSPSPTVCSFRGHEVRVFGIPLRPLEKTTFRERTLILFLREVVTKTS